MSNKKDRSSRVDYKHSVSGLSDMDENAHWIAMRRNYMLSHVWSEPSSLPQINLEVDKRKLTCQRVIGIGEFDTVNAGFVSKDIGLGSRMSIGTWNVKVAPCNRRVMGPRG